MKILNYRAYFIFFLFLLFSCKNNSISKIDFYLGTACEIKVYDKNNKKILKNAFDIIKKIDNLMSTTKPNSEVTNINNNSGKRSVPVTEETITVIKAGKDHSIMTNGVFDITSGPLIDLWGIGKPNQKVPNENEIKKALSLINYNKIIINEIDKSVFLEDNNMKLDLGGIAKGYAADKIYEYLKHEKVKSALINLGGNVYAVGYKNGGKEWNIGIQNPFEKRGAYIGIVQINNKAVVTSGKYERFFEDNGIRYHHIFDTKNGYPSKSDLASVTIITENAMKADALSTSIFLMGYEAGKNVLRKLNDINAVLITENKEIYLTAGLVNKFSLSDENFKLIEE